MGAQRFTAAEAEPNECLSVRLRGRGRSRPHVVCVWGGRVFAPVRVCARAWANACVLVRTRANTPRLHRGPICVAVCLFAGEQASGVCVCARALVCV